jgi:hypothetical protein
VKTLAASLRHFYNSEGQWSSFFERTKNPCCQPTTFYTSLQQWKPLLPAYDILRSLLPDSLAAILYGFKLVCGLQAKRSSGKKGERESLVAMFSCRFIYPNLSVRLRFFYASIRFSLFFELKTAGFSRFISVSGNRDIYVFSTTYMRFPRHF